LSRPAAGAERRQVWQLQARITALESRLSAIEQRVGTGAQTREPDRQIDPVRGEKVAAVDAQEYEQAASLRDQENHLVAEKEALQQDWQAAHPGLEGTQAACLIGHRNDIRSFMSSAWRIASATICCARPSPSELPIVISVSRRG